jgi:hypothetical protein
LIPAGVRFGEGGGWLCTPMHTNAMYGHLTKSCGINFINFTSHGFSIMFPLATSPL